MSRVVFIGAASVATLAVYAALAFLVLPEGARITFLFGSMGFWLIAYLCQRYGAGR